MIFLVLLSVKTSFIPYSMSFVYMSCKFRITPLKFSISLLNIQNLMSNEIYTLFNHKNNINFCNCHELKLYKLQKYIKI